MKNVQKLLPVCMIIFLLLVWQFFVTVFSISALLLPSPLAVFQALLSNSSIIGSHALQTLAEALLGMGIAVVLGLVTALALDLSSSVRRTLYPLLVLSQTIPIIALAPLFLLWFGFDMTPKIIIVVLFCFFPIAITTANGFSHVDKEFTNLLSSMRATYWQILWKVRFPSALPAFFAGVKIAATYAITAAMIGEYVGGYQGLGIFIQTAANAHATALVFAVVFAAVLLSALLFALAIYLEKLFISWKY